MSGQVLALVTEGEEAARELPMPVIVYFIITFSLFVVALGVTWTFRNTGYKVQPKRRGGQDVPHPSGPDGAHH